MCLLVYHIQRDRHITDNLSVTKSKVIRKIENIQRYFTVDINRVVIFT